MTTISLNIEIKVKLTDFAYEVLAHNHNGFLKVIPKWKKRNIDYYKSKADSEGFYTMPLYNFMHEFGQYMQPGQREITVDNKIHFKQNPR